MIKVGMMENSSVEFELFIVKSLKDVSEGRIYDFDEAFDLLEKRYQEKIDRKCADESACI